MTKLQRPAPVLSFVKKIKIEGQGRLRTITCPYCRKLQQVTLVTHLKRNHPSEWSLWGKEFLRLYDETNDLKKVMRAFTNAEGQLVLSWTSIEAEIRRLSSVNGKAARFKPKPHISQWQPNPEQYSPFNTTLWDIPTRGNWGVHQSNYRGNWPPQVPRALIEAYSEPGDFVLDPFVGGGTTLLEAWSLGRHATGFDVSANALAMSQARLTELESKANRETLFGLPRVNVKVCEGDARELPEIRPESVDLICTHPPYGDVIPYTHNTTNDLSLIRDPTAFLEELSKVAVRCFQVLKPGRVCAVLIGDMRRNGTLYALGFDIMRRFLRSGFYIQDIVIKTQNKERAAEFYLENSQVKLRIRHEYLFIFKKPDLSARD